MKGGAITGVWVSLLPAELLELADGDETAIGWLALAEQYRNADRAEGGRISGQAIRHLAGTPGQRLIAWHDLVDAVVQWHSWDLVADGQGNHSELNLPSRERVCTEVTYCLRQVLGQAVAS